MRGDFGVEIRGHWNAGGACDRRCAQPPADAANPHEVGHHVVARSSKYCLAQQARAVEVLPELNWGLQLASKKSVARNVVVADRFLKPVEPLIVERVASHERITQRQALIEVAPQLHPSTGRLPHGGDRRQIVAQLLSSQSQLQSSELTFGQERSRLSS